MCTVSVILFDYGGVLAEEGFREGLKAIGRRSALIRTLSFPWAEMVHETGYVLGKGDEASSGGPCAKRRAFRKR